MVRTTFEPPDHLAKGVGGPPLKGRADHPTHLFCNRSDQQKKSKRTTFNNDHGKKTKPKPAARGGFTDPDGSQLKDDTMNTMKIHQVFENTHGYHEVMIGDEGEMYTRVAKYLALVSVTGYEREDFSVVPLCLNRGELVPTSQFANYVGMASPGDDALSLSSLVHRAVRDMHHKWLERSGVGELIVGAE